MNGKNKTFFKMLNKAFAQSQTNFVQYFSTLSITEQTQFIRHFPEFFASKAVFSSMIEAGMSSTIIQVVNANPELYVGLIQKHNLKVEIPTKESAGWGDTARVRIVSEFHHAHPELVSFKNGADVKGWLEDAGTDASWPALKYVLKEVVPNHAKNPTTAFGSLVRRSIKHEYIPVLVADDFDLLCSDGDTLLNELFDSKSFKMCIANSHYPNNDFIETLELNCTMSAMEKTRTSRHSKRVARNLKRAKLLLEIKELQK